MKQSKCHICGKMISNANLARHIKTCEARNSLATAKEDILKYSIKIDDKFKCRLCGKIYSKMSIHNHIRMTHLNPQRYLTGRTPWNKGLTKLTSETLLISGQKISSALTGKNWQPKSPEIELERRRKISEKMKLAHSEGRANTWKCWKIEESYPEKFFAQVIENEFADKKVTREFWFFKFRLDFAWEKKKRVIEIDGQQHERCKKQQERDKQKDSLLISEGWEVLRIRWIDMFNEPQKYIDIAKRFIDGVPELEMGQAATLN